MAYRRGNGTVNVELARLQSWVEQADEDLYGDDRRKGVIKEHEEREMREATAKEQDDRTSAFWTKVCAGICAVPAILTTINFAIQHWPH